MIVNFKTTTVGLQGNRRLRLENTSTYEGFTATNVYWIITKSNGDIEEIQVPASPPLTGQTYEYPIDKDYALKVTLAYDYSESLKTSTYSKDCNVLANPNLCELLYDLRKFFSDKFPKFEDFGKKENALLEDIELIDALNVTACTLLSTDLLGSQLALKRGNALGKDFKHCNNIPNASPLLQEDIQA